MLNNVKMVRDRQKVAIERKQEIGVARLESVIKIDKMAPPGGENPKNRRFLR